MVGDKNDMKLSSNLPLCICRTVVSVSFIPVVALVGDILNLPEDFMAVPFLPAGTETVVLPSLSCLTGILT